MFLSVLNHKLCSNFKFHLLKLRYRVYIYIDAWWIKNIHIRHGLTMVIHNLTALIKFFRSTCMYTLCNFSFSSHRNSDIISCSFETHYSLVEQLCIYIHIFFFKLSLLMPALSMREKWLRTTFLQHGLNLTLPLASGPQIWSFTLCIKYGVRISNPFTLASCRKSLYF